MQRGDLVFCHNEKLVSRAIRWGEWLRFRKGAHWNHVATLYEPFGDDWIILQANDKGVGLSGSLSGLQMKGKVCVVPAPVGVDTELQLDFLHNQIGSRYGFLTAVSIVFTLLLPRFINVMLPNTWICSALAAEGLRAGGWLHNWPDLYQVTPAQLFEALTNDKDPT